MLTDLLLGAAVLALLIYRQLVPRQVRSSSMRITLVLAVIGVIETTQFLQRHHDGPVTIAALGGSLVLAAAFGAARARTVRVWLKDGAAWSQGNWVTAALWIVALAVHLGYDALLDAHRGTAGLGSATIVLYLALSLAVQRVIVSRRAAAIEDGTGGHGSGGSAPFLGPGPAGGRGR